MQVSYNDKTTMQPYLILSFATIALTAKQLALPSTRFVYKPVTSAFIIHNLKFESLPDTTCCATYYYSTEINGNLIGFAYGAGFCMVFVETNKKSDHDQGSIWQIS